MIAFLLTLVVTLAPQPPPAPIRTAAARSLALASGRVEVTSYLPALPEGCVLTQAELPPVTHSGRLAAKLSGTTAGAVPCEGQAWVSVRVFAPALVTQRAVRAGETLEGAVVVQERERMAYQDVLGELPHGARTTRSLMPGALIESSALAVGPAMGSTVTVVIQAGAVRIEQEGHRVACDAHKVCALLPSGKRVEGRLENQALIVELE